MKENARYHKNNDDQEMAVETSNSLRKITRVVDFQELRLKKMPSLHKSQRVLDFGDFKTLSRAGR